jgi:nucleoside phosphorylase
MATPARSPFTNEEYTVGWICALAVELAAAKGMMDEVHGEPQTPPADADNNSYILGSMGRFKVVAARLPIHQLGASSAAAVAKEMLFTFPRIRVGLLVGIGAGIPDYDNDVDIRLGDVVISSSPQTGGVFVYDFGKALADGSFESLSVLNSPPRSLGSALGKLQTEHLMQENKIEYYIEQMLERFPLMRSKGYSHPGHSADRLFQPSYLHATGKSCAKCDPSAEISREPRLDDSPVIHYGTIASGNTVIKDALTRDSIRDRHGAICLEMEAAGLMNNFPCIVIRGISDYADSHKNDRWQPFAAAAAAACAKEFLEHVQPKAIEAEPAAKDILYQGKA